ncbi:capsular biosynthesis protein [Pseudomonas oryzihabitans]|uniref:capsular biosynthesis protein n=1 Tax=Pseudomonas oryzihabitans TaxID=47885 RepID=UPI00111FB436|nr:capsular biosynthesis protein [Pseudomonas psychrotolerans]QDD90369.1 capsular biosynthesis protein [Pseudomonas psychrotolerans]
MDSYLDKTDGVLVVDVDGTLCEIKVEGQTYADVEPKIAMIEKLREYKDKGYKILLFTARSMRTYNNNVGMVNKHTAPVLLEWLERWEVPYDEILFGKPWPRKRGFYIDDRAIRPNEFLALSEEEIQNLLGQE